MPFDRCAAGFTPLEVQQRHRHDFIKKAKPTFVSVLSPYSRVARPLTGFTLVELLVVVSVVSLLSSVVLASLNSAREKGRVAQAASNADAFRRAVELYNDRMGFYPPDVGRGWDPGFLKPLPWNPDTGATSIPSCGHCPSGWDAIAAQRWDGPYIGSWPHSTPWGGKYDYNYWESGAGRYGCTVPAGVYIGIQRDYADVNPIPPAGEQAMLDSRIDADGCLNGEAQVILFRL